jgi:hypothetical protein
MAQVARLLRRKWSAEQVSGVLKKRGTDPMTDDVADLPLHDVRLEDRHTHQMLDALRGPLKDMR